MCKHFTYSSVDAVDVFCLAHLHDAVYYYYLNLIQCFEMRMRLIHYLSLALPAKWPVLLIGMQKSHL